MSEAASARINLDFWFSLRYNPFIGVEDAQVVYQSASDRESHRGWKCVEV